MANKLHFNSTALTLTQQRYYMSLSWPSFSAIQSRNTITWTGRLTPAAMADTYTVQITYTLDKRPDVKVLNPTLQTPTGKRIPHTFSKDNTLCLYLANEWHGGKIIARTIMHWICHWLFFYEIWLITEKWEGGGHEPPTETAA